MAHKSKRQTNGDGAARTIAAAEGPRIRNRRIVKVRVADILDNENNFRTHGDFQRDSFAAAEQQIGWFGYPDTFRLPSGKLKLIDGELRKHHLLERYGPDAEIEVNETDFDGEEAAVALATKDPLAALAGTEGNKLAALLDSLKTDGTDARLAALMQSLRDQAFEAQTAALAAAGGGDTMAPETDAAVLDSTYTTLSVPLSPDQATIIHGAIKTAKDRRRLDSTAQALAVICKDWSKTNRPRPRAGKGK